INQLSADLYISNKPKLYKNIDAYVKTKASISGVYSTYEEMIKEIDDNLQALLIKTFKDVRGGIGLDEITGVIEQVRGVITDARDFREKKIQSLTGLLKELKPANL